MSRTTRMWMGTALLVLGSACDAQVAPGYQGQALLTITGSVEIDSQRERGRLLPALAFYNDKTSEFRIVDVEVEGEFPSDFTLRVYQPPPPEAIVEGPDRPASAAAYITAVTEDHPETVRYARQGAGAAGCVYAANDDPDAPLEPESCEFHEEWCTSDGGECYSEHRICPAYDSPLEDCEVVSSSGDPSLRNDPWESFAGIADFYRIVYLQEALPADHPAVVAAGLPALAAGYHLFETRPLSEAELQERERCRQEADALAAQRYNEAHDTDYPPASLMAGISCPAPVGDLPDSQVPQQADGDAEPAPDAEQPADSLDCPELPPEEAWAELEELRLTAQIELACAPSSSSLQVIEDHEQERISVRIAADVAPF